MSVRSWLWRALGAFGGGAAMVVLGQLFALAGGSCTILCKPPVAGLYGAVLGLLLVGSGRRAVSWTNRSLEAWLL